MVEVELASVARPGKGAPSQDGGPASPKAAEAYAKEGKASARLSMRREAF